LALALYSALITKISKGVLLMRLTTLQNLQADSDKELSFIGKRGEALRVDVLEESLIRVRMLPEQKSRLDRTWLVLGKEGDAPLEGRSREFPKNERP
jgi:hypothetical protein